MLEPEIPQLLSWRLLWEAEKASCLQELEVANLQSEIQIQSKPSRPTWIHSKLLVIKIQTNNYLYKIFSD